MTSNSRPVLALHRTSGRAGGLQTGTPRALPRSEGIRWIRTNGSFLGEFRDDTPNAGQQGRLSQSPYATLFQGRLWSGDGSAWTLSRGSHAWVQFCTILKTASMS